MEEEAEEEEEGVLINPSLGVSNLGSMTSSGSLGMGVGSAFKHSFRIELEILNSTGGNRVGQRIETFMA